jgi:hypothetical protein
MTPPDGTEGSDSSMRRSAREPAQKEWRRPDLRKLPIGATASTSGKGPATTDANDPHGKASADGGHVS